MKKTGKAGGTGGMGGTGETGGNIRPTTGKVLGALFNVLGDIEGCAFLELFAGTGQVSREALRRGASRALLVEAGARAVRDLHALYARVEEFPPERVEIWKLDVRRALPRIAAQGLVFDIVFADPPYGLGWPQQMAERMASWDNILSAGALFILEHSKREMPPEALGEAFEERRQKFYGDTVLSFYRKRTQQG